MKFLCILILFLYVFSLTSQSERLQKKYKNNQIKQLIYRHQRFLKKLHRSHKISNVYHLKQRLNKSFRFYKTHNKSKFNPVSILKGLISLATTLEIQGWTKLKVGKKEYILGMQFNITPLPGLKIAPLIKEYKKPKCDPKPDEEKENDKKEAEKKENKDILKGNMNTVGKLIGSYIRAQIRVAIKKPIAIAVPQLMPIFHLVDMLQKIFNAMKKMKLTEEKIKVITFEHWLATQKCFMTIKIDMDVLISFLGMVPGLGSKFKAIYAKVKEIQALNKDKVSKDCVANTSPDSINQDFNFDGEQDIEGDNTDEDQQEKKCLIKDTLSQEFTFYNDDNESLSFLPQFDINEMQLIEGGYIESDEFQISDSEIQQVKDKVNEIYGLKKIQKINNDTNNEQKMLNDDNKQKISDDNSNYKINNQNNYIEKDLDSNQIIDTFDNQSELDKDGSFVLSQDQNVSNSFDLDMDIQDQDNNVQDINQDLQLNNELHPSKQNTIQQPQKQNNQQKQSQKVIQQKQKNQKQIQEVQISQPKKQKNSNSLTNDGIQALNQLQTIKQDEFKQNHHHNLPTNFRFNQISLRNGQPLNFFEAAAEKLVILAATPVICVLLKMIGLPKELQDGALEALGVPC